MNARTIHLLCNSHIDPVWLWEWEEGAAETLATFRTAAELCEQYDAFIFNHNEALLYQWIEAYDPALFERIRRLVRAKRWHIMGGWFLQPDCNMPSGESFVRQILLGQHYFRRTFGVRPTSAVNLDPFGHTRGLVQILTRSGYDSYLFCRPTPEQADLPADTFRWVGFDGSEVTATCAVSHYNSPPGAARRKVETWMNRLPRPCSIVPWGVGNHGGGPSRRDLDDLTALIRDTPDLDFIHSTPERYFRSLRAHDAALPRWDRDLNPWAVGCYTSMMRIKRGHRALESDLFMAEKMASTAAAQGLMKYPRAQLHQAACDLASSQFHDALPGTSIEPVEHALSRLINHGSEIAARVRARAFFALASGQRKAREGDFPILVYNPHPYPVDAVVECEVQPQWPHGTEGSLQPRVFRNARRIPAQAEQPFCNINEDHRKRIVFRATLQPSRMNRFDCRMQLTSRPRRATLRQRSGAIRFKTKDIEVIINTRTGLIDRYRVRQIDYLKPGACRPIVLQDDADPWGMNVKRFRTVVGRFRLMSKRAGTAFSGVSGRLLQPVRVIEHGPVRTVIEALFSYNASVLCHRYKIPRHWTELELETRISWNEKDRILKLSIPTTMPEASCLGQTAFGVSTLSSNGDEAVAQKWSAIVSKENDMALTCINDAIHGLDMKRGELRLSLLRAPAHAGHPVDDRSITRPDRFTPRIDQGEHVFHFSLNAGSVSSRLTRIDREALARAERPPALCYSPPGEGRDALPGPVLSDRAVQMTALKYAEDGDDLIIRLCEPTGRRRSTTLSLPLADAGTTLMFTPYEIKTLQLNHKARHFIEVTLLEERPH